jgi:hypothetical protein
MPAKYQSGEWPDFVTNSQFNQFASDNRASLGEIRETLSDIRDRLANGGADIAVLKSNVDHTIARMDEHSDSISSIKLAIKTGEALKEGTKAGGQPIAKMRETVVKTITTVIVTGCCALVWELIIHRDPVQQPPVQTNVTVSPSH